MRERLLLVPAQRAATNSMMKSSLLEAAFGMSNVVFSSEGLSPSIERRSVWRSARLVVGAIAAGTLTAGALYALVGQPPSGSIALGGHIALLVFALLNLRRAYLRFWLSSIVLLACVGATGVTLAILPNFGSTVTAAGLARFGLDGMHSAAQLGAVAVSALAWSTAGRRKIQARNCLLVVSAMALLQFLGAASTRFGAQIAPIPDSLADLCFALWLLDTVPEHARRQGRLFRSHRAANASRRSRGTLFGS
jgi:hypothetical protein